MCASPLSFFRAGPPPPKVVYLPDAVFFTRPVPVTTGATAAEAAAQVELALEALSPFPLAQLYYGWLWTPGSPHAQAFAAYRRRFTADQTAAGEGAEVVMPAFAALMGAEVSPATTMVLASPEGLTTMVLASPEGLTAVHWETPGVPAKVLFRPLPIDATEEDRDRVRDELVRAIGGTKTVIELDEAPVADASGGDREFVFRTGEATSRLPVTTAAALDVRDKAELAALRAAQKRDVLLWRVLLGSAALLVVLVFGELALMGGKGWQGVRQAKVRGQKPRVEKIISSQALAFRIEDLGTKRLLPFEMITVLNSENRRPPEITFSRVIASVQAGINTLTVEAVATNASLVTTYQSTLQKVPSIERAEARITATRGDIANFTLVVTFKPDTLKAADSIAQ
jgi:hypothetical protein